MRLLLASLVLPEHDPDGEAAPGNVGRAPRAFSRGERRRVLVGIHKCAPVPGPQPYLPRMKMRQHGLCPRAAVPRAVRRSLITMVSTVWRGCRSAAGADCSAKPEQPPKCRRSQESPARFAAKGGRTTAS